MTFKDLQRLIESQPDVNHSSNSPQQLLFARVRNKPFWLWDSSVHKHKARTGRGYCCFNHTIGLPRKDGVEKPLFDYEKMLYQRLMEPAYVNSITGRPETPAYTFKLKHLWVKKSTGLGVSEYMLRFILRGNHGRFTPFPLVRSYIEVLIVRSLLNTKYSNKYKGKIIVVLKGFKTDDIWDLMRQFNAGTQLQIFATTILYDWGSMSVHQGIRILHSMMWYSLNFTDVLIRMLNSGKMEPDKLDHIIDNLVAENKVKVL